MQFTELEGVRNIVFKFRYRDGHLTPVQFPPMEQDVPLGGFISPQKTLVVPMERRDIRGVRNVLQTLGNHGYFIRPNVITEPHKSGGYMSRFLFVRCKHPRDAEYEEQKEAFDALANSYSWLVLADKADSRLWVRCATPHKHQAVARAA